MKALVRPKARDCAAVVYDKCVLITALEQYNDQRNNNDDA